LRGDSPAFAEATAVALRAMADKTADRPQPPRFEAGFCGGCPPRLVNSDPPRGKLTEYA